MSGIRQQVWRRLMVRRLTSTLRDVIIERSMNDDFLSNTYVVADEPGGHAVMIDAGGPVAPLLDFLRRRQVPTPRELRVDPPGWAARPSPPPRGRWARDKRSRAGR